jgi:glutathione synthase/RimK-type ligase-like ATP-grasp enzyme
VIALATCAAVPELDEDGPLLLAALARRGATAVPAVWDDPGVDWSAFDLVVVRSTWDYPPRRDAFVAWARALPRVLNPPDVLAWSTDKRYLRDVAAAGVRVVETTFLDPGEPFAVPRGGYVVKPVVSAGSRDTARYGPGDEERAGAHVAALHAEGRTAMVQPYVGSVDERGETALLFLGGRYSHAMRKGPLLLPGQGLETGLFRQEEIAPRDPSRAELVAARRALDAVPGGRERLLYARVDLVEGSDGEPLVLELELAEPSLFLAYGPNPAEGFAELIVGALGSV